MPKKRNGLSKNFNTAQPPSSSTAHSALHSLMAPVCFDPSSSSEDLNSPNATANGRTLFNGKPTTLHFPSEPLSAAVEYALSENEYAARLAVEKTFHDERMRIEALFCVTSAKIRTTDIALADGAQLATRQLFLFTAMRMAENCVNVAIALAALQTEESRARDAITAEFTAAEPERSDMENMFKDDMVIKNLGADFLPASLTASQSRFFQPSAAATPETKSWTDWLFRR